MPLPRVSERAADAITGLLDDYDAALLQHVIDGTPIPNIDTLLDRIERHVRTSLTAAIAEVEPRGAATDRDVDEVVAPIRTRVANATARARRQRRQLPTDIPEQDDDEPVGAYIARVGELAAWVVAARALTNAARRKLAQSRAVPVPPGTAWHARMIVRTEAATRRNLHAAEVVDTRNAQSFRAAEQPRPGDWVVLVTDARLGPTDEPCERVNGLYATAEWARRHPVEHPNCTRRTRPVRLPSGRRVSLLR